LNFKKKDVERGQIDLVQDREQLADCSQHGNVPSVSTKCGEFLYSLWNYQILKKLSAPWS
jgi:hypothetical protein